MTQGEKEVDMKMNIVWPTLYPSWSMKIMSDHFTFKPYFRYIQRLTVTEIY
jgi:hypothetical protein